MNKQVFIINGSGGCGKDTFVSLVDSNTPQTIINFSSVDRIKEIAADIGWQGGKTDRDRKFLSDLKLLCADYNDLPFRSMEEQVHKFKTSDASMLFLHIREPDEIARAKEVFDAITILVKRDSIKHITTNPADGNVFDYEYDVIIDNDIDLLGLDSKAFSFCRDFNIGSLKNRY